MTINKAIQLALEYYKSGNLQQAEHICRETLNIQTDDVDALHFLGEICYQLGDHDLSISYIKRALELNPKLTYAYRDLGLVFQEKGQLDEAIACYQKALQLNPNLADAYNNLGLVFQEKGQLDEAITCYQKALQIDSNLADTNYNLGIALQEKGQLDEAITCYQKALQINPNLADAHTNLGNVFQEKGQLDEAVAYYQKALEINPSLANAYNNLGLVFQEKGQLDEAIAYYQKALAIDLSLAEAYYNLGETLKEQGMLDEAINSYRQAITYKPHYAEVYLSMGHILDYQGRHEEAISAYNKALDYNPNLFIARYAWCMSQLRIIYPDQLSIQISRRRYHDELVKLRDEISLDTPQDIEAAARAVGSQQPFYLAYQGLNDRELQQLYGGLVCRIMGLKYPQFASRPDMPPLLSGEPLRIGFISAFFYRHSNWKLRKGWVENIDKKRFSLYGYYTGDVKDHETAVARECFSRFVKDIYSFEEWCQIIKGDNLHVLIYPEIGMDPITGRLATLRLAPIQCTSWGHPDTSGLPTIDYYLSSDLMEPPDADDHYSERLIRLPNLSIYYTPIDVRTTEVNRETFGLRPKAILYLCCQALFKYLPQYDEVYPRIAQEIHDCQFLFIIHKSRWVTEKFRMRISKAFSKYNLNANDYVVFLPYLDSGRYHAINCLSDIYLDSIGWSGCNSTFEAIGCDLPIVTLLGEFMRGRHSAAILTMMGVTETIATILDEYIAFAVRLGQDVQWRHQISEKIAANKHLIYRDKTCITALEDFLEKAIKNYRLF